MRFLVGAGVGAAMVAGCLTIGLDALHTPRSNVGIERAVSNPEQRRNGQERPASSEPRGDIAQQQNAPVSIRESDAGVLLLGRSASWNEIVLFQGDLVGGKKRDFASAAESAPEVVALSEEPVALPKPRPAGEKVAVSNVAPTMTSAEPVAPPQPSSIANFFEKLFRFELRKAPQFPLEATGRTAVYDIETRAIYLPTGEILEAHSGLGGQMDDVRYVQAKSRGPTPPNVYALSLREKPFHGVQALRLTPVGHSKMFGRDGILAHPYMLGPNGQSNGCVSIQEYPKFLEAYVKGKVDRLIVVPRLVATPDVINASAGGASRRASL